MSKYDIVTSFNPDGLDLYGRNMLNSYKENWAAGNIKLHAWYHVFGDTPFYLRFNELEIPTERINYCNLNNVQDMIDYREKMETHNGTEGGKIKYNWRLDAISGVIKYML